MTPRKSVVSLVAALVVVSVFAPAVTFAVAAQSQQGQQSSPLVVESVEAPGAVTPNGTVTVTATISNPSAQSVTEDVTFRLDRGTQDIVTQRSVTVAAGQNRTVNFTFQTTGFETGDYIYGVTTANSSAFAELKVTNDAQISFGDQRTNGTTVTVNSVFVPRGGYVAIHDQRLLGGDAVGSVIGVSEYLEPGYHENVNVTLFDVPGATFDQNQLTQNQILIAMAHQETTGDRTFDFVSSNGTADGAYADNGEPVAEPAPVVVTNATAGGGAAGTGTPGTGTDTAGTDTAGTENGTATAGGGTGTDTAGTATGTDAAGTDDSQRLDVRLLN